MHPLYGYAERLGKYAFVFLAGLALSYVLTPAVRRLAARLGIVDRPDTRRIHGAATPRAGGLAVFAAFHLTYLAAWHLRWIQPATGMDIIWWRNFLNASVILLIVGLADDARGLNPWGKLAGQALAASVMVVGGSSVGSLLGISLSGAADVAATLLWFLFLINAFNLIDGLDGLAAGLAIVAALGLGGSFVIRRMPSESLVLLGLIGSCLGFLRYNFHPAQVFLGDTGSLFLGFTFASVSLVTGGKSTLLASVAVPLLAVGVPIFDTLLALWRRTVRAFFFRSATPSAAPGGILTPDLEHLHHRFLRAGWQQHKVAVLLYLLNAALVAVGLLSLGFASRSMGIFLLAFVVGVYVVVRYIAHVELWDTGRMILRGLQRPTRGMAAFVLRPVGDILFLCVCLAAAVWTVRPSCGDLRGWDYWITSLPVWVAPVFVLLCAAQAYGRVWRCARFTDYLSLGTALLAGVAVSAALDAMWRPDVQGRALQALAYGGLALIPLAGSRLLFSGVSDVMALAAARDALRRDESRRVLLYGADISCGLLRHLGLEAGDGSGRRVVVGIIDDSPHLARRMICGYRVLGGIRELPALVARQRVDELIATAPLAPAQREALLAAARQSGVTLLEWTFTQRALT